MTTHPISLDKAKQLLAGELGDVYRSIVANCCVPIFWFKPDASDFPIKHNGTMTIVQTPKRLIGITAAHVLSQYKIDIANGPVHLQLLNEVIDNFLDRVIDVSATLDIATFDLDIDLVRRLGKTPLSVWPPKPPEEGKGIMIAGYPAIGRIESQNFDVNFGLFTALVTARTVTDKQVTWLMEREGQHATLPPATDLGGISGGPLISWFESENFVTHHCLSGIVIEHPDYQNNKDMPPIERLIAIRADFISESGKIICI